MSAPEIIDRVPGIEPQQRTEPAVTSSQAGLSALRYRVSAPAPTTEHEVGRHDA